MRIRAAAVSLGGFVLACNATSGSGSDAGTISNGPTEGGTSSDSGAITDSGATDSATNDSDASDSSTADGGATYATSFPLAEAPISEGAKWINGGTVGLDWGNVQTSAGLAYGTVVSIGPPYNDSTAVLSGTWGPTQMACATVHTVNQNNAIFEEVELRLRTTISAHTITGYEFNFRMTSDGSQYAQIVRWNGPINSFSYVNAATGPGIKNGDKVCATAEGSTLTSFINGTQVVQGTDANYPTGSIGVGFYMQDGTTGELSDYGFSSFSASAS